LHNSYSSMPLGYCKLESSDILMKNLSICEYSSLLHDELFKDFEQKMLTDKYDSYHLAPSGGIAVEMALKVALQSTGRELFLTLHGSFHGVTGMSAMVTSSHFGKRVQYADRTKTVEIPVNIPKQLMKDRLYEDIPYAACIVVEPIQCSYGDRYLDWEFLKTLREYAKELQIPFIVDEIQTGFYATGKKFYTEELEPDIIIFGKKTQMNGILVHKDLSPTLHEIYDLISITHDADLADLARFKIVSDFIEQNEIEDFSKRFCNIKCNKFKDVRGVGHLWAIEFHTEKACTEFCEFLFKNAIIVNRTGNKVVRMRPSFVFKEEDMRYLKNVIKDYNNS